jgi:hypothetical protein
MALSRLRFLERGHRHVQTSLEQHRCTSNPREGMRIDGRPPNLFARAGRERVRGAMDIAEKDREPRVGPTEPAEAEYAWAVRSRLEPVKAVAATLKRHLDGVLRS